MNDFARIARAPLARRLVAVLATLILASLALTGCVEKQTSNAYRKDPNNALAQSGAKEPAKLFTSYQYGYKFVIPKGWSEASEMTKIKAEDLYSRSDADFETFFEKPSKYGELSLIAFVKTDLRMTPKQFDEMYKKNGFNGVYGVVKAFYSNALPQAIVDHSYDPKRHILRVDFERSDYDAHLIVYPSAQGLVYVVMNLPHEQDRAHKADLDVVYYSFMPLS